MLTSLGRHQLSFCIRFEIFLALSVMSDFRLEPGHIMLQGPESHLDLCFSWLSLTALCWGGETLPHRCRTGVHVQVPWPPLALLRGGLL